MSAIHGMHFTPSCLFDKTLSMVFTFSIAIVGAISLVTPSSTFGILTLTLNRCRRMVDRLSIWAVASSSSVALLFEMRIMLFSFLKRAGWSLNSFAIKKVLERSFGLRIVGVSNVCVATLAYDSFVFGCPGDSCVVDPEFWDFVEVELLFLCSGSGINWTSELSE